MQNRIRIQYCDICSIVIVCLLLSVGEWACRSRQQTCWVHPDVSFGWCI